MDLGDLLTLYTDLYFWGNQKGGKHSTKMKGLDKMGEKPPERVFSEQQKSLDVDLLPVLSKHTQSWICAPQLGRQDIVNSSLNPRECRLCSWQANAAFAAGRQQMHPLPSCKSSFLLLFKAVSGKKRSHCSDNY